MHSVWAVSILLVSFVFSIFSFFGLVSFAEPHYPKITGQLQLLNVFRSYVRTFLYCVGFWLVPFYSNATNGFPTTNKKKNCVMNLIVEYFMFVDRVRNWSDDGALFSMFCAPHFFPPLFKSLRLPSHCCLSLCLAVPSSLTANQIIIMKHCPCGEEYNSSAIKIELNVNVIRFVFVFFFQFLFILQVVSKYWSQWPRLKNRMNYE